ncbi:MAG: Rrf2 family transcriptional regulator [Chloroflexota bacterium]|nr:Rrf2 family transcriptional regulator [Chloroflexota bacterium]
MDIIRSDTDYALRALAHLALHKDNGPIAAKALASAEDIPEDFIYKLLRSLTKAGLVESYMGAQGGFALARDPSKVTLLEAVEAIQGPITVRKCLLGKDSACPRHQTCPLSAKLEGLQCAVDQFMTKITLSEILESLKS